MFRSRLTLHSDFFSSVIRMSRTFHQTLHNEKPRSEKAGFNRFCRNVNSLVRLKNPEAASGNNRQHVSATEAEQGVCRKHRILDQFRRIVIRINRARRKMIGERRVIRREGRCDHFIYPDACASEATIEAVDISPVV